MHTLFLYLQNIFNTRDDKKNICAVGFEPNPNHVLPLREIESSFAKCGWRTNFFTKTAVSNYTGKIIMVGMWLGENCSCCCLPVLAGSAWVLLNKKIYQPFFLALYRDCSVLYRQQTEKKMDMVIFCCQ